MPTLLRAAWVIPMSGPSVRGGGVVFDSNVHAVGVVDDLIARHPDAAIIDAGDSAILPGLVNAHVHLELSHLTPGDPPARFVDWLLRLMAAPASDAAASTRIGIDQCLKFGVTTVGDITARPADVRPVLAASPLSGVSYGEVRAMAGRRSLLTSRLDGAAAPMPPGRFRSGVSPHAPYSIEPEGYIACRNRARHRKLSLATHLAESADESQFLSAHTGPFRELWDAIGGWTDDVATVSGGPIRYAQLLGLLDRPSVLAHVNYCDDEELKLLAAGHASVVYCPRTHAYFGHPPHRWRDMLAAGINVAVGTDSAASSPDLNLVDDLRLLHRLAPDVPAQTLWQMATVNAAAALGVAAGAIQPGRPADLVVFPTSGVDPLVDILESDSLPTDTFAEGRRVFTRGFAEPP